MSPALLRFLLIAAAVMAGAAMLPGLPYGYFMLLRVVMCVVMSLTAILLFKATGREPWAWGCVGLALLFTPLGKVHLGRELWWWMDGVAAVWCAVVVNKLSK